MSVVVLMYSVEEAALALGLRRWRFYELIRCGALHTVKQGRRRLVPVASLEDYVAILAAAA